MLTFVGAIPVIVWVYLLVFRGGFWRISKHFAPSTLPSPKAIRIVAVVPARNEASVIDRPLTSLLRQGLPAPIRVVVVDDNSSDGTPEVAVQVAESADKAEFLRIIHGQPLAPEWTGKLWALEQGIKEARKLAPDYFLLTDADIVHGLETVAELVAIAEAGSYDLTSYMVKLACSSLAERALIPAFLFFFLKLYPPRWIASPKYKTAGAAGGCMLVRPQAIEAIGGLHAIRNEVIDDCALARAIKARGGRVWMGLTSTVRSIRSYHSFGEIDRMIARTAFNQLRHSSLLLALALAGLFLTYLLPVFLIGTGRPVMIACGLLAWVMMTIAYMPASRFYTGSFLWSLSLPLVTCFYIAATIRSAVRYWRGVGGEWKGRVQDAR